MKIDDLPGVDNLPTVTTVVGAVEVVHHHLQHPKYKEYVEKTQKAQAAGTIDVADPATYKRVNEHGAAILIESWNLEDKPTQANAVKLFKKVPQLYDMIMNNARKASDSLGKPLKSLTSTPETSTD